MDPFHDSQLVLEGLPDERSAPSVVQMHNQSVTITAPSSAGGANWDCKVSYTGFDSVMGQFPVVDSCGKTGCAYDHTMLPTLFTFGSLMVRSGASGVGFPQGYKAAAGDGHVVLGSYKFNAYHARIIGVAYEVHNTTAQIYKQGNVTTAMTPDPACDNGTMAYADINAAPWKPFSAQTDLCSVLAENPAVLVAVPTSATWDAREGVYAIPRLTRIPVDVSKIGEDGTRAVMLQSNTIRWCSWPSGSSSTFPVFYGVKASGFSPVESYFTGLSPETSLTVTFRTIVEYFPNIGGDLMSLATPSSAYDPLALAVYSSLARSAPYAVKVRENAAGDYFRRILEWIGKLGTASAPVTGAYGPLVGALASAASSGYKLITDRMQNRPPPVPRPVKAAPPQQQPRRKLNVQRHERARDRAGSAAMPSRR